MKRNNIVKKLMSEGFSLETLGNMSDKQIKLLSSRIIKEQIVQSPDQKKSVTIPTDLETKNKPGADAITKAAMANKVPLKIEEKEISETKNKNWIKGAIKKPGALHKSLGVLLDKKIPVSKLNAAAKKGGKLGERARFAKNIKGLKECDKTATEDTHFYNDKPKGKKEVIEKETKKPKIPVVNPGKEKKNEILKKVKRGADVSSFGDPMEWQKNERSDRKINGDDKKKLNNKKEINEWLGKLIENDYHCTTTKNEIMELIQSKLMEQEVPVKEPKIKEPGVKETPGNPDRRKLHDPWKKNLPDVKPGPKFSAEPDVDVPVKEPETIPDEPQTPTKPGKPLHDPWKKDLPGVKPGPKFRSKEDKEPMPSFLSFKNVLNVRKTHQLNETSSKIINLLKENSKKNGKTRI